VPTTSDQKLQEVSGDIRATWRTTQNLLHSRRRVVHDDAECADLVNKFSDFFIEDIRDNISAALEQSTHRLFVSRPHIGPQLAAFQPVAVNEVRKLLASIPCKTSPLDVLPCSLLKDCSDVFAPVIARLANMSLQAGTFPARFKLAQVLPLPKKAGLDRSSPVN